MDYLKEISSYLESRATKIYLIFANVILVFFAIWFSNVGVLPFKNLSDFGFFTFLLLVFALYRPGWAFALLVGTLALENVNLAPGALGVAIRPYQLLTLLIFLALLWRYLGKRMPFELPKLLWLDALPLIFALGGFVSVLVSADKGMSIKQSLVAFSFVAIYFLVRIFIQSFADLVRVLPFFLGSVLVVVFYGLWQNIRFIRGLNPFEAMPGRPNATFTEADWLGMFLVFALAVVLAVIFYQDKKTKKPDYRFFIIHFLSYLLLLLIAVVLILTVSRSAWLGAIIVSIGLLKLTVLDSTWEPIQQRWKEFAKQAMHLFFVLFVSLAAIWVFHLTNFQLGSRAASTGGLQKITIACPADLKCVLPQKINSLADLDNCKCRHINLEDIEKEKAAGNYVSEVYRPDPNVNLRAEIYRDSWQQIKTHPIVGIGWGSISKILGTDERGAGLNASNIFLETWLGAGVLGFSALALIFGYILVRGAFSFFDKNNPSKTAMVFVLLGWAAVIVPNIFNAGIFLGFVWAFLAVAVSLLQDLKTR